MRKKGFTLVEIIVCISLIAIIGVSSFFGVKFVRKSIIIDNLEKINDKILAAAEVYIETNEETYNQLYNEKNGVVIPLNVLINDGLLSLENTNLKQSDIEDEYVITALTNSTQSSTNNCIDIRTETSWKNTSSAPIYICTDSNGNSNLSIINSNEVGNLNNVSREPYYFRGAFVNNYVKLKNGDGTKYRIMYVDTDDSLVLYNGTGFGTAIDNSKTLPLSSRRHIYISDTSDTKYTALGFYCGDFEKPITQVGNYQDDFEINVNEGETYVDVVDILNTIKCDQNFSSWFYVKSSTYNGSLNNYSNIYSNNCQIFNPSGGAAYYAYCGNGAYGGAEVDFKIRLRPCMKITGGTGNYATPYVIEDKCS